MLCCSLDFMSRIFLYVCMYRLTFQILVSQISARFEILSNAYHVSRSVSPKCLGLFYALLALGLLKNVSGFKRCNESGAMCVQAHVTIKIT